MRGSGIVQLLSEFRHRSAEVASSSARSATKHRRALDHRVPVVEMERHHGSLRRRQRLVCAMEIHQAAVEV
jgi:hypothetical protein